MSEFRVGPLWSAPSEAETIGRLVLGYTELEIALWRLLSEVTDDSSDTMRAMFSIESSLARLHIANLIIAPAMRLAGLEEDYRNAFGEIDSCRRIRNSLAHAFWDYKDETLHKVDLREIARVSKGQVDPEMTPLTAHSLKTQEAIFVRAYSAIDRLVSAYALVRAEKSSTPT